MRAVPSPCCCSRGIDVLKVNDTITYTARDYANAETVGVYDDTTVFVPQMIAGECARVRIDYVGRGVAYGSVKEILTSSPARVQPVCEHVGKCGGCVLAHMRYSEQLRFKQNKVRSVLRKIGGLDIDVPPCMPSPLPLGYRNKLSLPVRGRRGNVQVGMFERNSHRVVPTARCALGGDWAETLVSDFVEFCNRYGVEPYNERTFKGVIRHLTGRYVDGQLLVTAVVNGETDTDWSSLVQSLSSRFDRFGVFVNINTAHNNVILGKVTRHVSGIEYIEGEQCGVKFRLRPDSFFQVNDGVKDMLYACVREQLDLSETEVLVDCFSGIGLLTNTLACPRFDTYAIEIEPSAVRDARDMAELNGTPRLVNVCGDVTTELPKIVAANSGKRMTAVVDPPRKGLNPALYDTFRQAAPDCIVYISCDPATLARDIAALSDAYEVAYVQPYDMFPQTDQVETVVRLTHRKEEIC